MYIQRKAAIILIWMTPQHVPTFSRYLNQDSPIVSDDVLHTAPKTKSLASQLFRKCKPGSKPLHKPYPALSLVTKSWLCICLLDTIAIVLPLTTSHSAADMLVQHQMGPPESSLVASLHTCHNLEKLLGLTRVQMSRPEVSQELGWFQWS